MTNLTSFDSVENIVVALLLVLNTYNSYILFFIAPNRKESTDF